MITKITLNNVASYKNTATLVTDKKVNLIYGLNGTGKSTFSKFLQNPSDVVFNECSLESNATINTSEEIHVYNQKFIEDNFYNSPALKGIFSLSKENKEAKECIDTAIDEIKRLEKLNEEQEKKKRELENTFMQELNDVKEKVWKIKKDYSGGDRVLEYCLKGYMKSDLLFSYIKNINKPQLKPQKTIEQIKSEVQLLIGDTSQKQNRIDTLMTDLSYIEKDEIWEKSIVGTSNSTFSTFIQKIGCSDWVRIGNQYLLMQDDQMSVCPFCQQKVDKNDLLTKIMDCFDESYRDDIEMLKSKYNEYKINTQNIIYDKQFETNILLTSLKEKYIIAFQELKNVIERNEILIREKLEYPSKQISLQDTSILIGNINDIINDANIIIDSFNAKIDNKEENLKILKKEFWENMRWEYDTTLSSFSIYEKKYRDNIDIIKHTLEDNLEKIKEQNNIIVDNQKNVINIQDAIDFINSTLVDLGIDEFKIESYGENLYRIKRGNDDHDVFRTLSEGEKMIISFLYFIAECKGKKSAVETEKKKIIVIDDPISSMSHIYIFNVGRLIHEEFLRSEKYEQVFILTHSLYFFYELTDTNHERRKKNQNLFRVIKNGNGSAIVEMKYEEIQNDYHSYWCIVKDSTQSPALIANCMRNIIDYFFGFVEKTSYNNVFQKPELRQNKFDAFNRYMNRESHSIGQNIFDIKEFDYEVFKEAFHSVFKLLDYEEHYNNMMGL